MAKQDAVEPETNALLDFFEEKEADFVAPREYECPDFDRTFYFLHASLSVDTAANNKAHFKDFNQQLAANYWSVACDADGNRFCKNHNMLKQSVKSSMKKRGFRKHCVKALTFLGEIGGTPNTENVELEDGIDGDVVDAEIEGTVEHGKKQSSNPAQNVS